MTTTTPAIPTDREDPMPAGMLGMWLFLAGEAMFFAGLLSAYIVLQVSAEQRELFLRSARVVSLPLTGLAAVALLFGAFTLARRRSLLLVAGLSVGFLVIQALSAWQLLSRETLVTASAVYDGKVHRRRDYANVDGFQMSLPPVFDVARTIPADVARSGKAGEFTVPSLDVRLDANYGPSRNNYFACYFLVNAAHALHVVGGLVALAWLMWRTRKGTVTAMQTKVVTLYWQFVNGVGIVSLVLLALG